MASALYSSVKQEEVSYWLEGLVTVESTMRLSNEWPQSRRALTIGSNTCMLLLNREPPKRHSCDKP